MVAVLSSVWNKLLAKPLGLPNTDKTFGAPNN